MVRVTVQHGREAAGTALLPGLLRVQLSVIVRELQGPAPLFADGVHSRPLTGVAGVQGPMVHGLKCALLLANGLLAPVLLSARAGRGVGALGRVAVPEVAGALAASVPCAPLAVVQSDAGGQGLTRPPVPVARTAALSSQDPRDGVDGVLRLVEVPQGALGAPFACVSRRPLPPTAVRRPHVVPVRPPVPQVAPRAVGVDVLRGAELRGPDGPRDGGRADELVPARRLALLTRQLAGQAAVAASAWRAARPLPSAELTPLPRTHLPDDEEPHFNRDLVCLYAYLYQKILNLANLA